jgi:putative oxidoreductase
MPRDLEFSPETLQRKKNYMKIANIIVRSLVGLIFVVFGSNMFLHFIPMPPPPEGPARDFMMALFVSHYLYVVGALQVVGGVLLLSGRWVPLGLAILAPVIVNILCFHILMAPAGLPLAGIVTVLALFLLWHHRKHFAGIVTQVPAHADLHNQHVPDGATSVHS